MGRTMILLWSPGSTGGTKFPPEKRVGRPKTSAGDLAARIGGAMRIPRGKVGDHLPAIDGRGLTMSLRRTTPEDTNTSSTPCHQRARCGAWVSPIRTRPEVRERPRGCCRPPSGIPGAHQGKADGLGCGDPRPRRAGCWVGGPGRGNCATERKHVPPEQGPLRTSTPLGRDNRQEPAPVRQFASTSWMDGPTNGTAPTTRHRGPDPPGPQGPSGPATGISLERPLVEENH